MMMKTHWIAMLVAMLAATFGAIAFPPAAEVPEHQVRLRVISVDAEAPADDLALSWKMDTAEAPVTTQGGGWSDWLISSPALVEATLDRYPNKNNRYWQVRVLINTRNDRRLGLEVESQLVGREPTRTEALLWGPRVGVLIWKGDDGQVQIDTLAGHGRRVYADALREAVLPPEDHPKQIRFGERYIGGDTDLIAWREGVERLVSMGFNAMHPLPAPVVEAVREAGIAGVWGAVYNPPGYAFNFAEDRQEVFADFVRKQAAGAYNAGWEPEDISFWVTSDEPGWYYPDRYRTFSEDPLAVAAFHAYLREQGLSPADLGKATWEEVGLIGRADYDDLPGRRLFYWTNRFYPWASSTFFAEVTRAYEAEMGESIPIMINFNNFFGRLYQPGGVGNNPDKQSPNAGMGQHDWLEFGRVRGSTCISTEDWFGDGQAAQWSFYSARLRAAARYHDVGFGALVIPRTSGHRPDGMPQKILALVGNGAKTIKFFTFGPEYNFPSNCFSEVQSVFSPLSRAMQLVARSEALLYPGSSPIPQIAILTPQSSQLWDLEEEEVAKGLLDVTNTGLVRRHMPYMTETFGLYTAFQHQAMAVDFVDELGLHDGGLSAHKLLFVTAPDLPAESTTGLLDWVEKGGTLVLTAGAGRHDRYHQPDPRFDTLLGITGSELAREVYPASAEAVVTSGTIALGGQEVSVRGPRETLEVTAESQVIARFPDGTPAILQRAHGNGQIIRLAFYPGTSYLLSGTSASAGELPRGFEAAFREHLTSYATSAGVAPVVRLDRPLIEAPVLVSDLGMAVTLLNWSGDDQQAVKVTVATARPIARATTASGAKVEMTMEGESCLLTLDLAGVDILNLYYAP